MHPLDVWETAISPAQQTECAAEQMRNAVSQTYTHSEAAGASNASSQAEVCGHAYLTETEQKKQPLPKEGLPCVFVSAEAVAPDVPGETYAFAGCCLFLITNSVPTTSAAPMIRQIAAFCTKPATMNITKEIAATVPA